VVAVIQIGWGNRLVGPHDDEVGDGDGSQKLQEVGVV
jgi:hypothetical protein